MLTGSIMILACFAFGIIIYNDPKMKIPFANPYDHVVFVDPQFGWSWYLPLFTGIATLILGTVILLFDFFLPRKIAIVFHHSVVEEDEFFAVSLIASTESDSLMCVCVCVCVCVCSKMKRMKRKSLESRKNTEKEHRSAQHGRHVVLEPHEGGQLAVGLAATDRPNASRGLAVGHSVLQKRVGSLSPRSSSRPDQSKEDCTLLNSQKHGVYSIGLA